MEHLLRTVEKFWKSWKILKHFETVEKFWKSWKILKNFETVEKSFFYVYYVPKQVCKGILGKNVETRIVKTLWNTY